MPAQIGLVLGDDNEVTCSGSDVTRASGAGVELASLIRLDDVDCQRGMVGTHRSSSNECPQHGGQGEQHEADDDDDVAGRLVLLAERIETHGERA